MQTVIDGLLAAQRELAQLPVDEILLAIDRVAERWLNPGDPERVDLESRLVHTTGLAPAMISRGFTEMMNRVRGIPHLLDAELGSYYALDRFVWRAGGRMRSRAWGPGLVTCVFSGNVPGIPAFDMALALALKSACLARPAQAEPHFAAAFAAALARQHELLGRSLAVVSWPHDAAEPYERAGAVIAYGSDETIQAIRAKVPAGVRFLGHGHKIGLALIAREAATPETARLLALDVAMYDQQGCVSPHMAFVERGGPLSPAAFAEACGAGLAELEVEMPRSRLSLAEAAALRSAVDEAEFTADAVHTSRDGLAWAVVHGEAAAYLPSTLGRMLRTFAVDDLRDAVGVAAPYGRYLQTVAFAGPDERRTEAAAALGELGASRICPIGRVQQPGAVWHHDGQLTAGALVRWTDMEG